MTHHQKTALALVTLFTFGITAPALANAPRADVVPVAGIQARIDQRVSSEAADRQAIQELLKRPDVRKIAGEAGLDIQRANAAVGLLSPTELKDIAAQVNQVNGTTGGVEHVTLAVTTIIIILLLIIILAG